MANIVNTHFVLDGMNKEASNFLEKLFVEATSKELYDTMWFFNKLYGEGKYDRTDYVDKMGAKWVYITDVDLGDGYCSINLESAWYAPIQAIEQLTKLIHEFDNDILITYQWEDENTWGTHGGGAGTKGKFVHNEDELDEDDFGEEPDWEDYEEYDEWNEKVREATWELQSNCIEEAKEELSN